MTPGLVIGRIHLGKRLALTVGGGMQIATTHFHSQHNVNAVVNAPPVQDSFLERWIQKVQGRNRRNLVFKQCGQRSNGGLLGAAAAADGLPQNIRQFDPEEIGNNQVDFAFKPPFQKTPSLVAKWLLRPRQYPLRGDTGIHHKYTHRSRSSRIISSVEGNGPGAGEGVNRNSSSFFRNSRRAFSVFLVGIFCSRSSRTSAAMERRWLRARLRRAS